MHFPNGVKQSSYALKWFIPQLIFIVYLLTLSFVEIVESKFVPLRAACLF